MEVAKKTAVETAEEGQRERDIHRMARVAKRHSGYVGGLEVSLLREI